MKKFIIALALVLAAGIGFTSTNAFAWGHGYGHGRGHGYGMANGGCNNAGYRNAGYNNADYQAFMKESADLRSEIAADRAELNAIMANGNPDPERARSLTRSISDKENTLADMARAKNVGYAGRGYGNGWNCGINGHNHRFGNCW